jgi:predicted RND superfamily exporter protein
MSSPEGIQTRIARVFARAIIARPGLCAGLLFALAVASSVAAVKILHVNTNQLDLISQDLRQVKDVKRVVDMIGGTGHLIIGMRGADEQNMKAVADDVAKMLEADKENVRSVTYKVSTEFVRSKAALFMKTGDLEELHRRSKLFLADLARRNNPFNIELVPLPPLEFRKDLEGLTDDVKKNCLNRPARDPATSEIAKCERIFITFDDIVEKYTRIGKKSILDDYYISNDRQMLTLVVKPMWVHTDLGKTGEFVDLLRKRFAEYSEKNARGFKFVEDYDGEPDKDGKRVEFGFTGSYKTTYDDSVDMTESLGPVSWWAGLGILLTMLAFFGKRFGTVVFVFTGLGIGVALAFGFAAVAIGELNMITSILGGILMGTGIDFGIFVVYRMREEYSKTGSAEGCVEETIVQAGPASFVAAVGVAASFYSLLLSDFRGFSQFGLLAGTGVFLIALSMYVWIPSMFLVFSKAAPKLVMAVLGPEEKGVDAKQDVRRVPAPKALLAVTGLATVVLGALGPNIRFDYDSRALMVENQPAVLMQDEINRRMQISADPSAVYTPSIEAAKALWDAMTPLDPAKHGTIDQLVSMYTFVPPPAQQEANAKILADWKAELSEIDPAILPPEYQGKWQEALAYLEAKPYTLDDVPPLYRGMFENLPTTRPENRGYLTFIYPKVDLWDGKNVMAFSDQVEHLQAKDGQTYHAAGSAVLMATLARIVLNDTRIFVVLTLVLLVMILFLDLRSVPETIVAMLPLLAGTAIMLGTMVLLGQRLNFMNIVVFPIVLGFGISQGVYFLHRFREGTSPLAAVTSVGAAVACSTITTLVGWGALLAAAHRGLKTMGVLSCIGMTAILVVTLTIVPSVLQIIHDRRHAKSA